MPDFRWLKLRSSECAMAARLKAAPRQSWLHQHFIEELKFDAIPFQQRNFLRLSCVHFGGPVV